jgi:hypothetical protein
MRSLLLFAPSYAAAANRKIYELAEPGHGGVAFSSTEKLEEANRVCVIEAHRDRPLRIEYDPDANGHEMHTAGRVVVPKRMRCIQCDGAGLPTMPSGSMNVDRM